MVQWWLAVAGPTPCMENVALRSASHVCGRRRHLSGDVDDELAFDRDLVVGTTILIAKGARDQQSELVRYSISSARCSSVVIAEEEEARLHSFARLRVDGRRRRRLGTVLYGFGYCSVKWGISMQ